MTKEEAIKKLADIIFYAAKSGYMPYDTDDEMCAMNIAKEHIDEFYPSISSDLEEAANEFSFKQTHERLMENSLLRKDEGGIPLAS